MYQNTKYMYTVCKDVNMHLTRKKDIDLIRTTVLLIYRYGTLISPCWRTVQYHINVVEN